MNIIQNLQDIDNLNRRELQQIAKNNEIKANSKSDLIKSKLKLKLFKKVVLHNSKKIKIDYFKTNNKNKLSLTILSSEAYLNIISMHLRIPEILHYLLPLNKFNNKFYKNKKQIGLFKRIIKYDFGNILNLYQIKINTNSQNNKESNHIQIIKKIYTNLNFIIKNANKLNKYNFPKIYHSFFAYYFDFR